jgi:hypothetical protein
MSRRKSLIALLLLNLVCSCSTATSIRETAIAIETYPPPTPEFVVGNSSAQGTECVSIDQTKIWQRGDTAEQLQDKLNESLVVIVDGQVMQRDESMVSFHLVPQYIMDSQ